MTYKFHSVTYLIFALLLGCVGQQSAPETSPKADILAGLGDNHFTITTENDEVQAYFDRGLILAYAFNHQESAAAFQKAIDTDPLCAMCYWGLAYVLGPNINAPMEPSAVAKAYSAVQRANALSRGISPIEKAA